VRYEVLVDKAIGVGDWAEAYRLERKRRLYEAVVGERLKLRLEFLDWLEGEIEWCNGWIVRGIEYSKIEDIYEDYKDRESRR